MHRRRTLPTGAGAVLLVLALTGCSLIHNPDASRGAAGKRFDLAAAQNRLTTTSTGTYNSELALGPLGTYGESGTFDIGKQRFEALRELPASDGSEVIAITRRVSSGDVYTQFQHSKVRDRCWSEITSQQAGSVDGGAPLIPFPTPVLVATEASSKNVRRTGHQVQTTLDAYFALLYLGTKAAALTPLAADLEGHLVPVQITLDDNLQIAGVRVEGAAALQALKKDRVKIGKVLTALLGGATARTVFKKLGEPVDIQTPTRNEVIPAGSTTCGRQPAGHLPV